MCKKIIFKKGEIFLPCTSVLSLNYNKKEHKPSATSFPYDNKEGQRWVQVALKEELDYCVLLALQNSQKEKMLLQFQVKYKNIYIFMNCNVITHDNYQMI